MGLERVTRQKKTSGFFKRFFQLVFLAILVSGGWYIYTNYERWLFKLQDDRYSELKNRLNNLDGLIKENPEANLEEENSVTELSELLTTLSHDNPEDAYIHFLKGEFHYRLFQAVADSHPELLRDLFFYEYIERYSFPELLNREHWYTAILALRKSLALGLPEADARIARIRLARLYLWGGTPYWVSGRQMVFNITLPPDETIVDYYNIIMADNEPRFTLLAENNPEEHVKLWNAIYALKAGNAPKAHILLNQTIELEDHAPVSNNALYLMGTIMKQDRKPRWQLFYYERIDLEEFIPRNFWFLTEYNFLLRFYGKHQKAVQVLSKYETGNQS